MRQYLIDKMRKFKKSTKLTFTFKSEHSLVAPGVAFDGQIIFEIGSFAFPFWIEAKRKFSEADIKRVCKLQPRFPNLFLVGTLREADTKTLRSLRVGYLANSGDFYLPIEIVPQETLGNGRIVAAPKLVSAAESMTSSKGMTRLMFVLLANNNATALPQRTLAEMAQLSLGAVNRYISQLEHAGFIKYGQLIGFAKLVDYWIADFDRYYHARLRIGTFSVASRNTLEVLQDKNEKLNHGFWSGAKAADLLLASEIPNQFVIYCESVGDLIKELRLRPDPNGALEVREKFWAFEWQERDRGIVPLLLVYTDLMLSSDPRDHNAAEKIKELLNGNTRN